MRENVNQMIDMPDAATSYRIVIVTLQFSRYSTIILRTFSKINFSITIACHSYPDFCKREWHFYLSRITAVATVATTTTTKTWKTPNQKWRDDWNQNSSDIGRKATAIKFVEQGMIQLLSPRKIFFEHHTVRCYWTDWGKLEALISLDFFHFLETMSDYSFLERKENTVNANTWRQSEETKSAWENLDMLNWDATNAINKCLFGRRKIRRKQNWMFLHRVIPYHVHPTFFQTWFCWSAFQHQRGRGGCGDL